MFLFLKAVSRDKLSRSTGPEMEGSLGYKTPKSSGDCDKLAITALCKGDKLIIAMQRCCPSVARSSDFFFQKK